MVLTVKRHTARTATLTFAAILAIAGALAYVTAPPKGLDGYRERAAATAETLASQVETASLWVQVQADGKATTAATLVGLEEAAEDGRAAATTFEGYEPPTEAVTLRGRFASLAAEQERWLDLPALSAPLSGLAEEWTRFEERAEP
ncbi:MAG TPA: hypothetical protein VFZ41_00720 [Solirubrobacterales bacterium]